MTYFTDEYAALI